MKLEKFYVDKLSNTSEYDISFNEISRKDQY